MAGVTDRLSRIRGRRAVPGLASERMTRRLVRLAGVVAVAAACLSAAGTSAAAVAANRYGMVSAMNGFWLFKGAQSDWSAQLAAMKQNRVQTVRSDAAWADIEPLAPVAGVAVYQWSRYDAWVAALAAHNLTWQPIIDYNTGWTAAIADVPGYAAFAQAVAARYGAGGSFWAQNPRLPYEPAQIFEIWNEEGGSPTYVGPWAYGGLYLAAHTAIHAVDPSASVDIGGLGIGGVYDPTHDYPVLYLTKVFADYPQLALTVDGLALHPYGATATDTDKWVEGFRAGLDSFNVPRSVPIDLTELGWTYQAGSESWRASQMKAVGNAFARSGCGIREAAPYDWVNPAGLIGSADFGLVDQSDSDTTLRPAGSAWFSGVLIGGEMTELSLCGTLSSTSQPVGSAATASVGAGPSRPVASTSTGNRPAHHGRRRGRRHHRLRRHRRAS